MDKPRLSIDTAHCPTSQGKAGSRCQHRTSIERDRNDEPVHESRRRVQRTEREVQHPNAYWQEPGNQHQHQDDWNWCVSNPRASDAGAGQRRPRRWPGWRAVLTVGQPNDSMVAAAPAVPIRMIFRRFWPFVRPDRRILLLSLVFVALLPASTAASIWVLQQVIDTVLVPRDLKPLPSLAGLMVGITVVGGLVSYANSTVSAWLAERFLLRMRSGVFDHLLRLSPRTLEHHRTGDLVSRLTGDVAAIEQLVVSGITRSASYAVRILIFAGLALHIRWELALLAFVVTPLFWIVARHFSRQIKQASREKRSRTGALSAVAEESLANVPVIQAYGQQEAESRRLYDQAEARMRAGLEANRMSALYAPAVELVELIGALLVLGVGAWELTQDRLTVGGLLAFVAYLSQLYQPIRGASRLATTVYGASASAERLIEVLDEPPGITSDPDAIPATRVRGGLELDRVSYTYPGASRPALRSVSLSVRPGEVVAVMGTSGAGKSTLSKLLLRFVDPDEGAIRLDGRDLRDLTVESLRESTAVVLQETMLFDRTIAENIGFGRADATGPAIRGAAWAANADQFVEAMPRAYGTRIGQRGRRLSGGQQQRLAIARALIRRAPVLVLDEPTASLDDETARQVMEPLRRLMRGSTTILITHDPEMARLADRTVVLDNGRLVDDGVREPVHDTAVA